MLAEFVAKIASLATAAESVSVTKVDDRKLIIRTGDGYQTWDEAQPPVNNHVLDLESMHTILDYDGGEHSIVYFGESGVIALIEPDVDRRNRLTIKLSDSPEMIALRILSDAMTQKQIVKILRTALADCVPTQIVGELRRLTISRGTSTKGNLAGNRESLGREIEQAARTEAGDLSESFIMSIPLYANPDFRKHVDVRCAIIVDYETEKLSIVPIGNDLEKARYELLVGVSQAFSQLFDKPPTIVIGVPAAN